MIADVINKIMLADLRAAIYRMPNEPTYNVCIDLSDKDNSSLDIRDFINKRGYIVAPFRATDKHPYIFIEEEISFELPRELSRFEDFISSRILSPQRNKYKNYLHPGHTDSFEEYSSSFVEMKRRLDEGKLKKVVLSKQVATNYISPDETPVIYKNLDERYPNAYVFCVLIPQEFVWVGATPERLLSVENGLAKTSAIAATRASKDRGDDPNDWTFKEKEEHEIVTEYILNALKESGLSDIECSSLSFITAGHLTHLCQNLSGKIVEGNVEELIEKLHPTPAVCGLPKLEAMKLIGKSENYERSYYSGFVGKVDGRNDLSLYVNIRCMYINEYAATIFVGGGLTSLSKLEDEWEETEKKAETILNVI